MKLAFFAGALAILASLLVDAWEPEHAPGIDPEPRAWTLDRPAYKPEAHEVER
jgi:hypothetical protein